MARLKTIPTTTTVTVKNLHGSLYELSSLEDSPQEDTLCAALVGEILSVGVLLGELALLEDTLAVGVLLGEGTLLAEILAVEVLLGEPAPLGEILAVGDLLGEAEPLVEILAAGVLLGVVVSECKIIPDGLRERECDCEIGKRVGVAVRVAGSAPQRVNEEI